MPSEAKLLFVEHLAKTNPHGQSLIARVKMTSSVGPEANAWIVSRFEISDDPDDEWLPVLRRQQLARLDDFEESRFLIDQTIHLGVDDTPKDVDPTRVRMFVWDHQASKSREFPLHDFYAFPNSALRLADYLLPFPEISTWSIIDSNTSPQSTDAPAAACRVIEVAIPEPPATAGYLQRWLWPDLRTVRLWIDAADFRLHLVEMGLSGGRFRTTRVHAWAELGGAIIGADSTVTDVGGSWSRITGVSAKLKGYGSDYYTRLRLETRSFGS